MDLTYAMLDQPIQGLMIPDWKVLEVRREPGHGQDARRPGEAAGYAADVRLYTLYGVPYRTVAVRCGG